MADLDDPTTPEAPQTPVQESNLSSEDQAMLDARQGVRDATQRAQIWRNVQQGAGNVVNAISVIQQYRIQNDFDNYEDAFKQEEAEWKQLNLYEYDSEGNVVGQKDPEDYAAAYDEWFQETNERLLGNVRTNYADGKLRQSSSTFFAQKMLELEAAGNLSLIAQATERAEQNVQSDINAGNWASAETRIMNGMASGTIDDVTGVQRLYSAAKEINTNTVYNNAAGMLETQGLDAAVDYINSVPMEWEVEGNTQNLGVEDRAALVQRLTNKDSLDTVVENRRLQQEQLDLHNELEPMMINLRQGESENILTFEKLEQMKEQFPDQVSLIEHYEQRLRDFIDDPDDDMPDDYINPDFLQYWYGQLGQSNTTDEYMANQGRQLSPMYAWRDLDGDGELDEEFIGTSVGITNLQNEIDRENVEYEAFKRIRDAAAMQYTDENTKQLDGAAYATYITRVGNMTRTHDWESDPNGILFEEKANQLLTQSFGSEVNAYLSNLLEGRRELRERDEPKFVGIGLRGRQFYIPDDLQDQISVMVLAGEEVDDTTGFQNTLKEVAADNGLPISDEEARLYATIVNQAKGERQQFETDFPSLSGEIGMAIDGESGSVAIIENKTRGDDSARLWRRRFVDGLITDRLEWEFSDTDGHLWIQGDPNAILDDLSEQNAIDFLGGQRRPDGTVVIVNLPSNYDERGEFELVPEEVESKIEDPATAVTERPRIGLEAAVEHFSYKDAIPTPDGEMVSTQDQRILTQPMLEEMYANLMRDETFVQSLGANAGDFTMAAMVQELRNRISQATNNAMAGYADTSDPYYNLRLIIDQGEWARFIQELNRR